MFLNAAPLQDTIPMAMVLNLKGVNPNLCLPYSSATAHHESIEFTTHAEPSALFIIPKDVVQKL